MRYVIAVGGNALTDAGIPRSFSKAVLGLCRNGDEIVITHGNGRQVGELATMEKKNLAILTAQTQAEIGLEIENALADAARPKAMKIATILTRVQVDAKDPEFSDPTKPVGDFLTRAQADRLAGKGFVVKKLINGYRRVVPSPRPIKILEANLVQCLLKDKYIVIAAGGGGVAVIKKGKLKYADAVIDKDFASSLLASSLKADRFVILTNVPGAYLGFGGRSRRLLRRATVSELSRYIKAGQFEKGSMLPKVQACIDFARKTGKAAAIGDLKNAKEVFGLKDATIITS